ncbi:MAG: hypothetical protein IJC81_02880 [Clostridia bacterium]|nr:hypothetical protein [Clostridia bacterium]
MRTMKRFIALVMVAMMLIAAAVLSVNAADEADYSEAAKKLASINIMKGDTSGNLMLENGVTRYQAALFFVQALTGETEVSKWNFDKQSAVFADVPEYGTAIDYANGIGLIRGRGDGTYGYNDPIIYQDMLVLAVRALGYETENMSYPYGYIDAAKKLGLNEDLAAGIANSKELTRGETSQIIWNMLNTYVAEIDPVSDKILYPDDIGATTILGLPVPRVTLLEKAEFSQGVIEGTVIEYNKAELSSDIATVVIDSNYGEIEIAASELDITARTNLSTFLGLPVTLYVDCKADEFEKLYSLDEEENEAKIIFAETVEFTNVRNIGDEGNIKVTEKNGDYTVTIGSDSFKDTKYNFDIRVLDDEDGWVEGDFDTFVDNFSYDADKKEYDGANSYGEVDYAVITETVDDEEVYTVVVLYKPYEFGQYNTRTFRYQPTVSDESFITIGVYNPDAIQYDQNGAMITGAYYNPADDYSYFEEVLLNSGKIVNSETVSVSKADGEASRDAKLSGESVRSGDFIFYYYNELDNVLVIGYNCGALKSGTLTSYSTSKETVKIAGTNYEYGFGGAFTNTLPVFDDFDFADEFLAKIDDTDNVQYVAVNGKVLYIQEVLNGSNYRHKHNYVITTSDEEIMAELLNMDVEDYREELQDGVYVSESGNLTLAVLNTANGKWTLAEVAQFECGENSSGAIAVTSTSGFVHKDSEFPYTINLTKDIAAYEEFGESFKGAANYKKVKDELLKGGLFAVRAKNGNVYNLSAMFPTSDWGMIDNGKVLDGLYFSDNAPKTNKIISTRKSGVEEARVTLTDSTVIVVIDKNDKVGVRVGIQGEENSIRFTNTTDNAPGGFFYSATNKLIVLKFNNSSTPKVWHNDGTTAFNVADWADADVNNATETYYVATSDADVEYEKLDDGTYDVTISGLFNLRTMRNVSAIKVNMEELDDNLVDGIVPGAVAHMKKNGDLEVVVMDYAEALLLATDMRDDDDDDFEEIDMSGVEFVDDCSITVDELGLDKKTAIGEIKMTVATVDTTGIDFEKFDIAEVAYMEEYDDENDWDASSIKYNEDGDKYYYYEISDVNVTEVIVEPTAGVLNQYIIDTAEGDFEVAKNTDEYFENAEEFTVELYACAQFDEDTGLLTVYVLKLLK